MNMKNKIYYLFLFIFLLGANNLLSGDEFINYNEKKASYKSKYKINPSDVNNKNKKEVKEKESNPKKGSISIIEEMDKVVKDVFYGEEVEYAKLDMNTKPGSMQNLLQESPRSQKKGDTLRNITDQHQTSFFNPDNTSLYKKAADLNLNLGIKDSDTFRPGITLITEIPEGLNIKAKFGNTITRIFDKDLAPPEETIKSIEYIINNSKTAREIWEYLSNSPDIKIEIITTEQIKDTRIEYNQVADVHEYRIYWNPTDGLIGDNAGEKTCSKIQKPAVGLFHELAHAVENEKYNSEHGVSEMVFNYNMYKGFPIDTKINDASPILSDPGFYQINEAMEENNLQNYETPIAQELGESTRDRYFNDKGEINNKSIKTKGHLSNEPQ